jgi:hypothetical protein
MTDLTTDELRALVEALRAPADLLQESDFDALLRLLKREYGDAASLPHMQHAGTVMQMRALWEAARAAPSLAAEVLALREERERLRGALALTDKALRPAVVQAAGGPRIAEIGQWLATADDAIGLIEAALAEPQP